MERKADGKLYQILKADNTEIIYSGGLDNNDIKMKQSLTNSKNVEGGSHVPGNV